MTDTQLEILSAAWAMAPLCMGVVIADDAIVDAHRLAEDGWLRREFDKDGELVWVWTPAGETALDLSALMASTEGREN